MKKSSMTDIDKAMQEMWDEDPERAAKLAYLELLVLWDQQVRDGRYEGVPSFHRHSEKEKPVRRQKSPNYEPDAGAGVWFVPGALRNRWKGAA